MDFPSQGKLEKGYLANILIGIHCSKFTGTLGLTKDDIKKVISFASGKPVSSRSNILKESLGAMLVSKGRITESQLKEIVNEVRDSDGLKIGQVLITRKVLTNFELDELLKNQIIDRIKRCLFWDYGDYKIVEGKFAEAGKVSVDESLPEIIYRASSNNENIEFLLKSVPVNSMPVKTGSGSVDINDLRISGKELSIFRQINGIKNVDAIMKDSKSDEKFVLGFIYALTMLGIVTLKSVSLNQDSTDNQAERKGPLQSGISVKSKKLYEGIQSKLEQIKGKNFFEYFGADQNASMNDIKTEYFKIAKDFHPDKLPKDFSFEMKKDGEKLFSMITDAYNTLADSQKRTDYLSKISLEAQGTGQAPSQILESEIEFQKGQILLKKADFEGACEHFKRAIALYPDEAEYFVHLGMALFRKGAKVRDSVLIANAKKEIEKGISKNPNLDRSYLFLGHIYKFEKNTEKAKNFYQKALDANPKCLEASSELRLLTSRKDKSTKPKTSKGFFKKG